MTMISGRRTVLYYPRIEVPTGHWIRQAVLYSDEVASIVPREYGRHPNERFSADLRLLRSAGAYRPLYPDRLVANTGGWEALANFRRDFERRASTPSFLRAVSGSSSFSERIYRGKVAYSVFHDYLRPNRLAVEDSSDKRYYRFEKHAGLLYMTLLAKHLAPLDSSHTVPGTDLPAFERIGLSANDETHADPCLSVLISDLLPVPTAAVPLTKILSFREKHRAALLRLRGEVDKFYANLYHVTNRLEVDRACMTFRERLEGEVLELQEKFGSSRIPTIVSSLKALLDVKSPVWLATSAVVLGKVASLTELPTTWTVGGVAAAGAISVASHLTDRQTARSKELSASPFAFVYLARKNRILSD